MKHSARVVMMMAGLALGASACGPDVPANPDWATDVRPIIQARCVRCHYTVDPTNPNPHNVDPAVADMGPTIPLDSDAATPILGGLFTTMILPRVRGGTAGTAAIPGMKVMPPLPNARLEDWQIEIFANYAKNHM